MHPSTLAQLRAEPEMLHARSHTLAHAYVRTKHACAAARTVRFATHTLKHTCARVSAPLRTHKKVDLRAHARMQRLMRCMCADACRNVKMHAHAHTHTRKHAREIVTRARTQSRMLAPVRMHTEVTLRPHARTQRWMGCLRAHAPAHLYTHTPLHTYRKVTSCTLAHMHACTQRRMRCMRAHACTQTRMRTHAHKHHVQGVAHRDRCSMLLLLVTHTFSSLTSHRLCTAVWVHAQALICSPTR
jgi:hypothetical protein